MKWKVTEQWQRRYFLLKGSKYCRTHEPQRLLLWKKNSIHCSNIIVRQRSTFSKSSWLSTTTIYPWQTIMSNYLDPGVGMPYFCRSKHRPGFLDKKPMRSLKLDLGILQKIISEANKSLWYFKVLFSKQSSQISTTFWFSNCK